MPTSCANNDGGVIVAAAAACVHRKAPSHPRISLEETRSDPALYAIAVRMDEIRCNSVVGEKVVRARPTCMLTNPESGSILGGGKEIGSSRNTTHHLPLQARSSFEMRTPRAPAISLSKALALPAPAASQITPPRASFSLLARNVAQPGAPRPCSTPRASQSVTARSTAAAAQPLSLVRRGYSTSSKSIKDAEHPTGLWYHPLSGSSDTTRYAVSFLSQAPKSQDAKDVIAVLSVPAAKASDPAAFARQNPDKAVANRAFWDLLHTTLKEDVVQGEKDAILTQEADLREDGWAHLAGESEATVSFKRYKSADNEIHCSARTDQRQLLMPGRSE